MFPCFWHSINIYFVKLKGDWWYLKSSFIHSLNQSLDEGILSHMWVIPAWWMCIKVQCNAANPWAQHSDRVRILAAKCIKRKCQEHYCKTREEILCLRADTFIVKKKKKSHYFSSHLLYGGPFKRKKRIELIWEKLTLCKLHFCHLRCEPMCARTQEVRWAKGWRCQNSTVSGSGSAEQLLWCPGSKDSWVQFFSSIEEHGMLGRLQHRAGFRRFNEVGRPVGKNKVKSSLSFLIF